MTPLPDVLPIRPFARPVCGEAILPGSKSISNRALLLAALCDRPATLTNALFSEDTRIMADALRRLGFVIEENEREKMIRIEGRGGRIPAGHAELGVGNAGTAARFLTALCAAAPEGKYTMDGVPQMRRRPMKGLIEALRTQGAKITCHGEEGFFPITIEARGLKGGNVDIDAHESSQMLSALLMVAPLAREPMKIKPTGDVRQPFVGMTKQLQADFGVGVGHKSSKEGFSVGRGPACPYRSPGIYAIEPDASAASYFLVLPLATGGELHLPHLRVDSHSLQGDARFAGVLRRVGITIKERLEPNVADEKPGSLLRPKLLGVDTAFFKPASRRGVEQDFNEFSDTFLTLAAIAPLLEGPTHITGIAHTRKQETDRVAGAARELRKLGQGVVEEEDALTITPRPLVSDQAIETYGDHRFAMSFAILGCHDLHGDGRPWLSIKNPACCAKTFPDFFDVLEKVRKNSPADSR